MKEYIEKDAAEKAIRNDLPLSTWMKRSVDKAAHAMGVTIAAIDAIPAADVVEVRRAAWQSWEQDKPPFKWYSCDYCGFHALSRSNYCPNCGSKMTEV